MQSEYRLKSNREIAAVYKFGSSVANQQFVLYYLKSKTIHFRLAISTSKKLGGAVVRNRIRRQLKEIVRLHQKEILGKHDFVMIVRRPALDMPYLNLEKSVLHIFRKAKMVNTFLK